MLVKREYSNKTVIFSLSVATVYGSKPLVGLAKEVQAAFEKLKKKFGVKEKRRRYVQRTASATELELARRQRDEDTRDRMRFRKGSDVQGTMAKFRSQEQLHLCGAASTSGGDTDDVFSPNWRPPKYDKNDPDYGRPKRGSLTEKRGIAAGHHIGKEIVQLCEVITEYGTYDDITGFTQITFGELFSVYVYISDKVVGMLLRARKHKLLLFEGEMLYQRRDEGVVITLLRKLEDIRAIYEQTDDPAHVLSSFSRL